MNVIELRTPSNDLPPIEFSLSLEEEFKAHADQLWLEVTRNSQYERQERSQG